MTITLYDVLTIKYPTAVIGIDGNVQLINNGVSDEILAWNVPNEIQPTQAQIDAWLIDATVLQQYTFKQNKIANKAIYDQLDIIDAKSIRALRTNDTVRLTALEAQAAALRGQLLPTA